MDDEEIHKVDIEIPFPNKRLAEVAFHVLRVDAEPKRSGVTKELEVCDNILHAHFTAKLAKQLRVAVNGYFDNISLICQTIDFAGPPVSEKYDYFN